METSQSPQTTAESLQKTPAGQVKRKRPDDSPEKGVLANLSGDICGHCTQRCTESGKQGQAVQCDLCGVWVHAECDGISADQYKLLVSLTSSVENIAYLCKLNSCQSWFKQMIFESVKAVNVQNELTSRLEKVEAKLNETVKEVSAKIDDLCSSNNNLKQQITVMYPLST